MSSLTLTITNDKLLLELRVESGEWSSLTLTITNDELSLELRVESEDNYTDSFFLTFKHTSKNLITYNICFDNL